MSPCNIRESVSYFTQDLKKDTTFTCVVKNLFYLFCNIIFVEFSLKVPLETKI